MPGLSQQLLSQWTSQAKTRDGTPFRIRPLRPDDRAREIAFLDSLSERTRYLRLQRASKGLPPHLLDLLMDVDYEQRMAIVGTVGEADDERFIAVARYGDTNVPGEAEFAIAVADTWQGRGVGYLLGLELLRFARCRGLERLSGLVLPENDRMLSLAKSLGFSAKYDCADHVMKISLELTRVEALRGAA
jgi:acetyltransferase